MNSHEPNSSQSSRSPEISSLRTLWLLLRTSGIRGTLFRIRRQKFNRSRNPKPKHIEIPPLEHESLAVVTANFGGYDPPAAIPEGLEHFYCYADRPDYIPVGWKPVIISTGNPQLEARRTKLLLPELLPDYRCSLWFDSNLVPVRLNDLIDTCIELDRELITFRHPERKCIYCEAKVVKYYRLDDRNRVEQQIRRYRESNVPRKLGLWETSLLFRKHTDKIREFSRLWFEELQKGSVRDQLSLPVVACREGLQIAGLPGCREENQWLQFYHHPS